ncbi:ABC transporter ATP-binding protein [Anaerosacchariphilus polymeriproducens]|uniref:ABC transporter ATP-binding protein n=1 Tax=Anaerosacchariphilus polymeriproducens TaxID=1812858 RepID=A0A371ASD8_9FIRM|nr:ABC transporter ATP-binding protein [Anaerosacchariphilus polymeriproducens]RDU22483.1 ABC transporter ATP-binding protein [Anaerosacchariphilus polymeriproducens]
MSKNKIIIKRVIKYIKGYKIFVFTSLLFAAISVALTLYVPILIGNGIDYIIKKDQVDFEQIFLILRNIVILVGFTSVSQWIMNLCNNKVTYGVAKNVRDEAFFHLEKLPLKFVDSHEHGDIVSRIVADIDQFSDGLLMGFTQLFTGVLTILGTLIFMLSIQANIALVVVCITPISLVVASFIAKHTFSMFQKQSATRGEITSLITEMIGNQKVVQAFGYEEEVMKRFDDVNERLKEHSLKAVFYSSTTNPSTRFINGLVYTGVGIFGAISAMNGMITIGQITSFLSYANQYTKPFNEISGVVTELQNAIACAGRVFEFIDEQEETADFADAVNLEHSNGKVELKHVDFSYNQKIELIKDFNLSVEPGQRIAIVGPTGCGKSTIINLLMRFYDVDEGEIKVSGNDIRNITRRSLRENYGMVLQETWLKSGTIAENIAYGNPNASMNEIVEAAKQAYAHNFIKKMPQGYETVISEDGGNLSQGQKQLLCIARVMLRLPPILILDEATSSIDTRTEIKIQKAFHKMMKGRTSFVVAHRLSTIKEADIILVMKDGKIIEQGNHEYLLEKQGFYYELYHSQFAI